ncbi:MAG: peptidylprolyl isomerase [Deltaproteobacteria bacterium]|nr:peptidylprolyl isomerase [Deltaproteobacteria bacterium]
MLQAKLHDTVRVHYTVSLKDGSVFDSTEGREPFEFTIGEGMVIPGFENGVLGMREGETKTFSVSPEDGYGEYNEDLVVTIDKSYIPPHINPEVGMVLRVHSPHGGTTLVTVKQVTEDQVMLDANHPLAGKELTFEVKLLEILK